MTGVDSWSDARDLIPDIDTCVIGGGTYWGYEQLWGAVATDPQGGATMLGRMPSEREVEYARWAQRTPHYIVSRTMDEVKWEGAHVVRNLGELRVMKQQPGGAVYVIGGASLVSSLINEGLVDELRLIVHPIILGGKGLFSGVRDRQTLQLTQSHPDQFSRVVLTYRA